MCPSTVCPNCSKTTYHKGSCENPACGYDPMGQGRIVDSDIRPTKAVLQEAHTVIGFSMAVFERPFPHIRVITPTEDKLEEVMGYLGYEGPTFCVSDGFGTIFGFDMVKDKARPWMDAAHA